MPSIVSREERNLSVHQEHEFLLKLETAGLDSELAQRVIDSKGNTLAKRVVAIIREGDPATQVITVNTQDCHGWSTSTVVRIRDPQGKLVVETWTGRGGEVNIDLPHGEYKIRAGNAEEKEIRIPLPTEGRYLVFFV